MLLYLSCLIISTYVVWLTCNALNSFSLLPSSTVDGLSSNRSSHVGFFSDYKKRSTLLLHSLSLPHFICFLLQWLFLFILSHSTIALCHWFSPLQSIIKSSPNILFSSLLTSVSWLSTESLLSLLPFGKGATLPLLIRKPFDIYIKILFLNKKKHFHQKWLSSLIKCWPWMDQSQGQT